jgi:Arc/MetJ family transcription regulator
MWKGSTVASSHIDLDDEALAEVAAYFGTKTKKDTVNTALRVIAVPAKQSRALRTLVASVKEAR